MSERYDLTFDGQPAMKKLLVQMLSDSGVTVEPYEPLIEQRSGEEVSQIMAMAYGIGIGVVTNGSYDVIKAVCVKFETKVHISAVKIEPHNKGRHRK